MNNQSLIIRWLGRKDYQTCWQAMQTFTRERNEQTSDEIWLLEHDPVFTQGQAGKQEHLLNPGTIPVIHTDRGGQVTYHGPGQLMVYTLIDLKRKRLGIREFVSLLEQAVVDLLASYNIKAHTKCKAPGVYINKNTEQKICSVGLRVKRGCSYHGIAFNIAMDLTPFTLINPCGFAGLQMTQLIDLGGPREIRQMGGQLANYLFKKLGYTTAQIVEED